MKKFPEEYIFARGCMDGEIDFSKEELVDGRLTDASLSYGETEAEAITGLPERFNYYALARGLKIKENQGRITIAHIKENDTHCLLSVIKYKDACNLFSYVRERQIRE